QELAREVIAGTPHLLEKRQELPPIARRPPGPPPAGSRRRPQAADRRLAMTLRHAAVLIQDSSSLSPRRVLIPPAHHLGILAATFSAAPTMPSVSRILGACCERSSTTLAETRGGSRPRPS